MHELLNGVRVYMLIPTIAVFFGLKSLYSRGKQENYQRRNQGLREAFIIGSEQLRSNEHIVDITDLDEENRIDGVFQTDIKVELSADNRKYFTNVELLRKIHNQVANKIVEGMDSFEGLEYVETVDGLPVYRVMIGD